MTKRVFDIIVSLLILILFSWMLAISWIVAVIDTRSNGLFFQNRVGQFGNQFKIFKLRTIKVDLHSGKQVISNSGKTLRKYKLDELPQLFNVILGEMSIVGPRPDLPGYYDLLTGENRKILELKPGLTSLASLKYSREEEILEKHECPLVFNDLIIFPDKVSMNLIYYHNQSFFGDVLVIFKTVGSFFK